MEERGEVPETMSLVVITNLYKNKGSRLKLQILNTDYKILIKVLANRIKEI